MADTSILVGDSRVGPVLRGQLWVQLNGAFTIDELRAIATAVEENSAVRDKGVTNHGVSE